MAIKWPKMLQMSWFLDQKCISMGFIKFWKNFEKFWKLADFWPKNDHFARIARRFFGTRFSTENVSSLWKMLQSLPNLVYICPKVSSTITRFQNYHILSVSRVMGHLVHLGSKFWAFFAKFKQKLLPRCTKWPRTRLTDKIWWFWNLVIVEDNLGHVYTKFGDDRSIFHRLDTFSVENRVPK